MSTSEEVTSALAAAREDETGIRSGARGNTEFLLAAMRPRESLATLGRVALGVLIVDDNASFLGAAQVLLEREGLSVVGVASTTADAVRLAADLRPDVVLVDIMLGRESGFALARRLVEDGGGGESAVILISTHAQADFAELIAESPAAGFLPKSELSADAISRILD
jgi:DNA-binding NarL/FixJ family response regulator